MTTDSTAQPLNASNSAINGNICLHADESSSSNSCATFNLARLSNRVLINSVLNNLVDASPKRDFNTLGRPILKTSSGIWRYSFLICSAYCLYPTNKNADQEAEDWAAGLGSSVN